MVKVLCCDDAIFSCHESEKNNIDYGTSHKVCNYHMIET